MTAPERDTARDLARRVATLFGGGDTALDDGPDSGRGWSHVVRVPVPADAEARLLGPVRELLVGEGFEEVDRSTGHEIARQFRSPGADVGVQIARTLVGDVVVGASVIRAAAPAVPPAAG